MNAMKYYLIMAALFFSIGGNAQKKEKGNNTFSGGVISLGARTTGSLFNDEGSGNGTGLGGQFRVQFSDEVNSDWFADYITSPLGNFANRTDYHIGWSVMFYPLKHNAEKPAFLKPYMVIGHCFDYTRVVDNRDSKNYGERWSSAVQGGLGTHFNLTPRMDISLTSQYMIHLGNDILAEGREDGSVVIKDEKGSSLEGHLLMTVSMNYKIADLW
jgi:hypothetical protein